jgi:hypothetical protein
METDPLDLVTSDDDAPADARRGALNSRVAITVALLATFLGIMKVKDDNIVQGMQQAQVAKLDAWQFYQARNLREEIAKSSLQQLTLEERWAPPALRAAYDSAIARADSLRVREDTKKRQLQTEAQADSAMYDALNYRDDQFDLADALLAIAISMLAMTSLTQKPWMFWLAMIPTAFGVLMGVAGLSGLHLHADTISRLLS